MWATENMFKKLTEQELDAMIIRHDSVRCAEATNFIFNRNKHIITKISITFLHVQQLRCPNFSGSVSVSTKNLRTPNLASPKSQHQ